MKSCYVDSNSSLRDISKEIAQYLWQHEDMDIDRFLLPDGEYRVQGQARCNTLRRLIGWDKRIVVRLRPNEEQGHIITLDAPVWKDKVFVLAVSLFGLWPLSGVVLWGIADQFLLLHRLRHLINAI